MSEEMREAAELLYPGLFPDEAYRRHPRQISRVAARIADAERMRELEATVARVDALAATWERRARTYSDVDERDKARDVRARVTALRRALDGDQ